MTTGKNPAFVIIDEVSPLVEADFAEIEKRVLSDPQIQDQFFSAMKEVLDVPPLSEEPPKASDFVHPQIANAYQIQVMAAGIAMGRHSDAYSTVTGRFRKAPEFQDIPTKRAKTKAARKQRRQKK